MLIRIQTANQNNTCIMDSTIYQKLGSCIHVDYAGLFEESHFLLMVDAY